MTSCLPAVYILCVRSVCNAINPGDRLCPVQWLDRGGKYPLTILEYCYYIRKGTRLISVAPDVRVYFLSH